MIRTGFPKNMTRTYMTRALIIEMLYLIPASAAPLEFDWRFVLNSDRKLTGARFLRKLSRSFLKPGLIRAAKLVTTLGAMEISGNISTYNTKIIIGKTLLHYCSL